VSDDNTISRRSFIERTAVAGAAVAVGLAAASGTGSAQPAPAEPTASGKSRVAVVTGKGLGVGNALSKAKLLEMLDVGVKHLHAAKTPAEAWRRIAGPADVVAIKVNCISDVLYTTPLLATAVAQRLAEAGVKPAQIIIFDRTSAELEGRGFAIMRGGSGVQCYGTDGDWSEPFDQGTFKGRLSKIVTEKATVLVNLPVLKDHGASQVTLAMKNHYGTIDNPGPYHGNWCDPHIADINSLPAIRNKTRLIVCDCIRGCFRNGPGPGAGDLFSPLALITGKDPVACDTIGTGIIDEARASRGLPTTAGTGQLPRHIVTAAKYGLGTNQTAQMDVLKVTV
jgi:uncharacterized protein (DUF362 family)